eukprot:gene19811-19711_t
MKEGIHPNYREVLFVDLSNGFKFVTRSCVNTKETETFEGKDYPLFKLDTSSESHPFYTGTQKSVDNMGGRVEKFRNRFGKTTAANQKAAKALPRWALLLLCMAYVIPGFVVRDPWKSSDVSAFGYMLELARGKTSWLNPLLGGVAPETDGL